jgi:MSHA biogenesis protein MshQ
MNGILYEINNIPAIGKPMRSGYIRMIKALGSFLVLVLSAQFFATPSQAATYANKSIPFNWVNTSSHAHVGYNTSPYKMNGTIAPGTACGTAPPILDDTISDDIPFGFNFNYGGTVFTSARIMSNGRLQFNNNTACGFGSPVTQLPYMYYSSTTNNLNYSMRIYGNDLDPTPQANASYTTACKLTSICYMSYATIGTAPNRQFVVTWNSIPEWAAGGSTSGNYNLQIILNEDGTFVYQYGSDTAGPQATLAQVGWQVDQTDYDIPNVGLPANNSAILFYIPSPVAQYHFQQSAWTAPGQVLDTSGSTSVYNGTALGGATPGAGYVCNGAIIPNNTSTATINSIDTGIPVPTALGGVGTIDFWYKANAAWVGGGDAQLLDATTANGQWFFVVKRNNGNVRFVITDSSGPVQAVETTAYNIAAGTWTHIAVTWNFNALAGSNNDHMSIYINGTQVKLQTFTTSGTVSSSVGTLYLGDNRSNFTGSNGTGNSANGTLDEVNIYNFEGGTGLIQRDMNYTASCGPDHLVIQSAATGLTCAANTLTVVACQDAACSSNYIGGVTGTLNASGTPTVNWDGTTGGATGAGFVIPAGSGSVPKNVQVATTGTVTFGVTTATPAPINPTTCNFGSPACTFTSNTAGFIVSNSATGNTYTIPSQVSGIATPPLYLRALQTSTTNPAVCTPAIINSTTSVNMGYTCNNPTTCQAGNLATINATAIAGSPNSNPKQYSTPVSLAFDTNGSALITARYDDVGQITLNANATVTPFSGATPVALTGSSAYIVKPGGFVLSAIKQTAAPQLANPAAVSAAGMKFVKAGEAFTVTVTARNALGNATKNYGQENLTLPPPNNIPESVKLTPTLVAPAGGNNPVINGVFGTFSNGVATGTGFTWNEVGIITLTPSISSGNYLVSAGAGGAGDTTGTISGNVGRFYAAQFGFSAGSITNRADLCPAGANCPAPFTYMGEQLNAVFTLTAQAVGGTPTQNYTTANGFAKLDPTAVGNPLVFGAVDSAATPTYLTARLDTSLTATGNFAAGVATITAPLAISRGASADGPYASLDIGIAPQDSDGALMAAYDLDTDAVAGNDHTKIARSEARYGQIKISNAHGSELLKLPITVTAQYWGGSIGWLTSNTDNISSIAAANVVFSKWQKLFPLSFWTTGSTSVVTPPTSVVFTNGTGSFILSAPGANNTGSVDMTTNGTGASPSTAAYLPSNTAARATFGVYKGAHEFIYLRENY